MVLGMRLFSSSLLYKYTSVSFPYLFFISSSLDVSASFPFRYFTHLQHNGTSTIFVSDFTVDNFRKLYRACENRKSSFERYVIVDGSATSNGDILSGFNSNLGDTATVTNSKLSSVTVVCVTFEVPLLVTEVLGSAPALIG